MGYDGLLNVNPSKDDRRLTHPTIYNKKPKGETPMNLYDLKILSLLHLLATQLDLFSNQDKTDLLNLIDTLPNDTETISNEIVLWYADRPKIKEAMLNLSDSEPVALGPGGKAATLTPEGYKELIKNAIRQGQSDDQSSQDKNKPKQ